MQKKFDPNNLIRKNIRGLTPYSSARHEHALNDSIFMDANENAFGSVASGQHNRYPDPLHRRLRSAISEVKGIPTKHIFVGNGSDESIDLLLRAFCEPGQDKVIIMPPTYGMYSVSARINDIEIIEVPLKTDFDIDVERVLNTASPEVKLLFVCSPNNPTGNCISRERIESVASQFPGIVILDEAYIDYALTESFLGALESFPNLAILQTLSKAWGMANLRLGMAFASERIIEILYRIKPPYNINGLAQQLAIEALGNSRLRDRMISDTKTQREWLMKELKALPQVVKIHNSEANFLLVRVKDVNKIYDQLSSRKIIVRNHSNSLYCDGCLRITVGTPDENRQLIAALKELEV